MRLKADAPRSGGEAITLPRRYVEELVTAAVRFLEEWPAPHSTRDRLLEALDPVESWLYPELRELPSPSKRSSK